MDTLTELRAREEEGEREWEWLHDALNKSRGSAPNKVTPGFPSHAAAGDGGGYTAHRAAHEKWG